MVVIAERMPTPFNRFLDPRRLETSKPSRLPVRLAASLGLAWSAFVATATAAELTAAELFEATRVWTVHLTFDPAQWEAMEPKEGAGPMGGGPVVMRFPGPGDRPEQPGGPRGPGPAVPNARGGPGGPGGPGGAGFGPGMFVGPMVMQAADTDQDGRLAREEFHGLAGKWFSAWDEDRSGALDVEGIRKGLNASLVPPGFGPPGGPRDPGGPSGPSGPRGPGPGGGPGLMLQGREGQRNGLSSAMGIEFEYVHADLEFEGRRFSDVAVRYKGNGTFMQSRASQKRSLKIDLNKHVTGQKLAGVSTLNLHNCVTDASWMNEVLSHRLFRDAGVPAPRTAYARVFVTVAGKHDRTYLGLYSLVENIDGNFAAEQLGSRKGALFKPVTPELFSYLGDDWANYRQTYDAKTDLTPSQQRRVIEFARLVSQADDTEFLARLADFVDLDNFARFMAVTAWLATLDSILAIGQNYYLHLDPKTRKFRFLPWDLDHSFGQFWMMGSQEQREQLSLRHPWLGEKRFLERVFRTDAFLQTYLARFKELDETVFRPERFHRQVDEIAAAIRPAVKEESAEKLERFDKVVAGEGVPPEGFGNAGGARPGARGEPGGDRPAGFGGGGPGGFLPFLPAAKPIKPFVVARAQSVADQLAGRSEGARIEPFGFGPGGPGPRGGPGGRGGPRGGPGAFGPGTFLADPIMSALDADKSGRISREEFVAGFVRWFEEWDTDRRGFLDDVQLRDGLNRALTPAPGGGPGGPGNRQP